MKIKKLNFKEYLVYTLVIAVGIAIDQLTKFLAVKFLEPIDTLPLINKVLHLTYVENRGAAFGMLADKRYIFMIISTVMIVAIGLYLYLGLCEKRSYAIPLAMIVSGGIGNMIDRIALGYVVDFIDFRLINFAVFNGADSFVCVGAFALALLLLIDIFKEARGENKEKKVTEEAADEGGSSPAEEQKVAATEKVEENTGEESLPDCDDEGTGL